MAVLRYLAQLRLSKIILWCYLCWYLVHVVRYFDAHLQLWLSCLGLSAVVGVALLLSVREPGSQALAPWQVFRLFFMPFAVSSYSALIKNHGFILIFPPSLVELAWGLLPCVLFVLLVHGLKRCLPARS